MKHAKSKKNYSKERENKYVEYCYSLNNEINDDEEKYQKNQIEIMQNYYSNEYQYYNYCCCCCGYSIKKNEIYIN